jgi:hypothetical protein
MPTHLTRSSLTDLCDREGPWVSIFTPLAGGGPLVKQSELRYRALLDEAREQLRAYPDADAARILEPLEDLMKDGDAFNTNAASLVAFANADGLKTWHLPAAVDERAVVDRSPHLVPLLPMVSGGAHFYVVAVHQQGVQLFSCDAHEARPLPLPSDAPRRLEDAAGYDLEESHLQFHKTQTPNNPGGAEGERPIYHGHGGGEDDEDVDIEKFLRAVDDALWRAIPHTDEPVVIACDPNMEGIFRRVTRLPNVVDEAVHGNYEHAEPSELHARAWAVMKPRLEAQRDAIAQRFHDKRGAGQSAERSDEVVKAACEGRVEALMIREGASAFGDIDETRWQVTVAPQGDAPIDLIDRAATETFLKRGEVYRLSAEEMPTETAMAAVLRW